MREGHVQTESSPLPLPGVLFADWSVSLVSLEICRTPQAKAQVFTRTGVCCFNDHVYEYRCVLF